LATVRREDLTATGRERMTTSVVVADRDKRCRRLTSAALRHGGYAVETARSTREACSLLRRRPVAAVVLDPTDADPVSIVQDLCLRTDVPIVVVSALAQEHDKVAVVDAGADDYLTKPFGVEELLARLRAALHRSTQSDSDPPIVTAHFTIDLWARRLLLADGSEARLTPTECRLVEVLVRNAGHLVSHTQVLPEVWGAEARDKREYVRVCMASIRHKIEPSPARPNYFITSPGLGLLFLPEGRTAAGRTQSATAGEPAENSAADRVTDEWHRRVPKDGQLDRAQQRWPSPWRRPRHHPDRWCHQRLLCSAASVQPVELGHLLVGEGEIEYLGVFLDAVAVGRFGDHHQIPL
jgi:two-component system, OmpR family, KDP operon response regulator KdpE